HPLQVVQHLHEPCDQVRLRPRPRLHALLLGASSVVVELRREPQMAVVQLLDLGAQRLRLVQGPALVTHAPPFRVIDSGVEIDGCVLPAVVEVVAVVRRVRSRFLHVFRLCISVGVLVDAPGRRVPNKIPCPEAAVQVRPRRRPAAVEGDGSRRDHPPATSAPKRRSASWVDRHWIPTRSPCSRRSTHSTLPRKHAHDQTVPTGFSSVPPSGPATPVIAMPASAPKRSATPRAIARATASETAPSRSIASLGTPRTSTLIRLAYATTQARKTCPGPGCIVMRCARRPPVQLSASATVASSARSLLLTASARSPDAASNRHGATTGPSRASTS